MEKSCKTCRFGANQIGYRGSIYGFRLAVRANNRVIDYADHGHGCRKDEWAAREKRCLRGWFTEWNQFDPNGAPE